VTGTLAARNMLPAFHV